MLRGKLFGHSVGTCVSDASFKVVVLWEMELGLSSMRIKLRRMTGLRLIARMEVGLTMISMAAAHESMIL